MFQGTFPMFVKTLEGYYKLLMSRKKWGLMFCCGTITGFVCHGETLFFKEGGYIFQQIVAFIAATMIAFLIALAGYILNDARDVKLDMKNGKKNRPCLEDVSKSTAYSFVILFCVLAGMIALATKNWRVICITAAMIFLVPAYSLRPFSFCERFVLKTLSISISKVFCLLLGICASYQFVSVFDVSQVGYICLVSGLIIFATSTFNDMGDVIGDREVGRVTIPVRLGQHKTIGVIALLIIAVPVISLAHLIIFNNSKTVVFLVGLVSVYGMAIIAGVLPNLERIDQIRCQHKKLFLLNLFTDLSITLGGVLPWLFKFWS